MKIYFLDSLPYYLIILSIYNITEISALKDGPNYLTILLSSRSNSQTIKSNLQATCLLYHLTLIIVLLIILEKYSIYLWRYMIIMIFVVLKNYYLQ